MQIDVNHQPYNKLYKSTLKLTIDSICKIHLNFLRGLVICNSATTNYSMSLLNM